MGGGTTFRIVGALKTTGAFPFLYFTCWRTGAAFFGALNDFLFRCIGKTISGAGARTDRSFWPSFGLRESYFLCR